MTTRLIKRETAIIALQTTPGQAEALDEADAVRVMEAAYAVEGARSNERESAASGHFGRVKNLWGGSMASFGGVIELSSNGATTAPEIGRILRAAAFTETLLADDPNTQESDAAVEYTPATTGAYLTARVAQDGWRRQIIDAVASALSFEFKAGEVARAAFTIQGRHGAADAATINPQVQYPTADPLKCKNGRAYMRDANGNLLIDGLVDSATIDFGLTIAPRVSMSDAQGFAAPLVSNRAPTLSIAPEFGSENWRAAAERDDEHSLEIAFGEAGNMIVITAPRAVLTEFADAEREGVKARDLTFQLARAQDSDDSIKIRFQ